MFPFRNILFPTDFSAHAHAALKYAAAFARDGRGRVLLLNVQDAKVPQTCDAAGILKSRTTLALHCVASEGACFPIRC